MLYLLSGYLKW